MWVVCVQIGRLLIRRVLADMTGRDFIDIRLRRTDKGKPFLEPAGSEEDFHGSFNVAHHGDYAVLAADADHAVGTDVMKVEHSKDSCSRVIIGHSGPSGS